MNNKLLIPILIGIVIVILVSLVITYEEPSEPQSVPIYDAGFTYYDIGTIRKILTTQDIFMSTPVAITDHTISHYCTFFDKGLPRTVEYCTTTVVTDIEGNTLGNINIGGDTTSPVMAIANLETLTLESDKDEVFTVFETVIETLVCDCWEDEQSKDYESITAWLEAVHMFYYDSDNRNIKSKIDSLGDVEIFLEITPKENSILQTLIILK